MSMVAQGLTAVEQGENEVFHDIHSFVVHVFAANLKKLKLNYCILLFNAR